MEEYFKEQVAWVAEDKVILRDDRQHLVSQENLKAILKSNRYTEEEVRCFFARQLILPVDESEEQPYHVGITKG